MALDCGNMFRLGFSALFLDPMCINIRDIPRRWLAVVIFGSHVGLNWLYWLYGCAMQNHNMSVRAFGFKSCIFEANIASCIEEANVRGQVNSLFSGH